MLTTVSSLEVSSVNGEEKLSVLGAVDPSISFEPGMSVIHSFLVVSNLLSSAIIGIDFLTSHGAAVNLGRSLLRIGNVFVPLTRQTPADQAQYVQVEPRISEQVSSPEIHTEDSACNDSTCTDDQLHEPTTVHSEPETGIKLGGEHGSSTGALHTKIESKFAYPNVFEQKYSAV